MDGYSDLIGQITHYFLGKERLPVALPVEMRARIGFALWCDRGMSGNIADRVGGKQACGQSGQLHVLNGSERLVFAAFQFDAD